MEIFAETNANTFVRLPLAEKSDKDKETEVKAIWFQNRASPTLSWSCRPPSPMWSKTPLLQHCVQ